MLWWKWVLVAALVAVSAIATARRAKADPPAAQPGTASKVTVEHAAGTTVSVKVSDTRSGIFARMRARMSAPKQPAAVAQVVKVPVIVTPIALTPAVLPVVVPPPVIAPHE